MRYFFFGLLIFLILGVSMAPASLLTRFTEDQPDLNLLNSRGSIWQGQADLLTRGRLIGFLSWSIAPTSLLTLSPRADWQLDQTSAQLYGDVQLHDLLSLSANGNVQAAAVNEWLSQYDIYLEGQFEITDLFVELDHQDRRVTNSNGTIHWSGGRVRFTLSGLLSEQILPPMIASFDVVEDIPRAVVVAEGDSTPLMVVQPGLPGYIKVGITKRFTEIIERRWPGNHAAHTIVLEVEEKIL